MFRSKAIVSACLALVVLLLSTAAPAANDDPASQQPPSPESANNQSADETRLRIGPGDPVAGKDKAALCFGCHGEDGNSVDPTIPKLSGQYAIYISKQIRNYLASTRSHQVMSGMAGSVSDGDLADISAYFASQPIMKGAHPSDNKLGKKLFENDDLSRMMVRCNSCHGATGKGLEPGNPVYPVIGGQHKKYLLDQLISFRKGARNNSPGGIMNITVHRLSDAELEALADYVSGL
jgi:cytochrome c553